MKIKDSIIIPSSLFLYLILSPVGTSGRNNGFLSIFGSPQKEESPLSKPFVNDLTIIKLTNDDAKIRLKITDRKSGIPSTTEACDETKLTDEIIYKCSSNSKVYDIVWSAMKPNILTVNSFENGSSITSQILKYW